MRGHTAARGFLLESENRIRRSARFERTDLLEVLAFKKERTASRGIQAFAPQDRRPMNVRANPFMRRANSVQIEHRQELGGFSVPKRFPTVIRCSNGSSSEMKLRKRSEKTALRRVR